MYINEFQDYELVINETILKKIQARWRGAVVRKLMNGVRDDYLRVFEDIEESPSCRVDWGGLAVSKPHHVPLDKQPKSRQDGRQEEEDLRKETPSSVNSIAGRNSCQSHVEKSLETYCTLTDLQDHENGVSQGIEISPPKVVEHQTMLPGSQLSSSRVDQNMPGSDHLWPSGGTEEVGNSATGSVNVVNDNFVQLVGSSLEEKRHNLALELLWIQQAIHSRKQYLRMKSEFIAQGNR